MKNLIVIFALLGAFSLSAQHIGYLIPSGGQPGQTVEILVGGQQLWNIKKVRVTGEGITVESVAVAPGIPNVSWKQQKWLTQWMLNVVDGKDEIPKKPDDEEELKTWRKHTYFERINQLTPLEFHLLARSLFVRRNPLQMSPAINQNCIIRLKIAPDAKPGRRELRLVRGSWNASNPLPFYVDELPEVLEPFHPVPPRKPPKYEFKLPAVINGQIMPGETDVWYFTAKKGEKLVFQTFARSMIPFMGDCVPGYFQCVLELRDSRNNRIAFADDNGFDPDPLLCCTIPEDGEYALHVRDALYRGRADFVYRIRAYQGDEPEFKLVPPEVDLPRKEVKDLPRNRETVFPVLLSGCIGKPGQTDKFVIQAEKGTKIVGEVFARRQGSSLDSRLTVLGPDGKQVAFNDDFARVLAGPVLQHTDSYLCFTAPETGKYTFLLTDTSGLGSGKHAYFLRIDRPRPSFNLYVTPSAPGIFIYGATPLKIRIEPLDGFNRDIRLTLKAPKFFSITGTSTIPAGTRETMITLTTWNRKMQLSKAELIAEAKTADGRKIRGRVFYGDEDTQAFAYTHLILSEDFLLNNTWGPAGVGSVSPEDAKKTEVKIKAGGITKLKLKVWKIPAGAEYKFELRNAPAGLTLARTEVLKPVPAKTEFLLHFKADPKMKPQRFILPVNVIYTYKTRPDKNGKVSQRKSEFILPVLLFTITGG